LNQDEHQYLIDTLLLAIEGTKPLDAAERRLGLWDKETMWKSLAFNETLLFSVLDYPISIKAMSLYAVYKIIPMQSYKYEEEFRTIMKATAKTCEDKTFLDIYKTKNSRVFQETNEKEYYLPPNKEEYERIGRELIHQEALDHVYKGLGEYLRKERDKMLDGGDPSLFTWTNLHNKIRCFCKKLGRAREALEQYQKDSDIKRFISNSGMADLNDIQHNHVLVTLFLEKAHGIHGIHGMELATFGNGNETGKEGAIKQIAREITLNADSLY
jgi:hypothetical protein